MTTDGPILAGIEVVVVGSALAADLATMVLADNGAAVTRIEPPGGDPRRGLAAWRMWNRGAGSIVLAADSAADRSRLTELVAGADVLIETGWPEGRFLNRSDIDAVSRDTPVLLRRELSRPRIAVTQDRRRPRRLPGAPMSWRRELGRPRP